jgi:hypothetical protein
MNIHDIKILRETSGGRAHNALFVLSASKYLAQLISMSSYVAEVDPANQASLNKYSLLIYRKRLQFNELMHERDSSISLKSLLISPHYAPLTVCFISIIPLSLSVLGIIYQTFAWRLLLLLAKHCSVFNVADSKCTHTHNGDCQL